VSPDAAPAHWFFTFAQGWLRRAAEGPGFRATTYSTGEPPRYARRMRAAVALVALVAVALLGLNCGQSQADCEQSCCEDTKTDAKTCDACLASHVNCPTALAQCLNDNCTGK
jgi:hypothetical protein